MNSKSTSKILGGILIMALALSIAAGANAESKKDKGTNSGSSKTQSNSGPSSKSGPSENTKSKTFVKGTVGTSTGTSTIPSNCPKSAFGHLISFGWIKKNGRLGVPAGCPLPPGIAKLLGQRASTTTPGNDRTVPVISSVSTVPGATTATVSWVTNEAADSKVFYSTTNPVNIGTASVTSNGSLVTSHSIALSGLTASTTYYALVTSTDASGNIGNSSQFSFTTTASGVDTVAPVINNLIATPGTSTISVSWTTNEAASSRIYFAGISPVDVNSTTTSRVDDAALVTTRTITVSGLNPQTTYFLVAESKDAAGNTARSLQVQATTGDSVGPIISSANVVIGTSTMRVGWLTNELATSRVFYATTSPVDLNTAQHVDSTTLVSTHDVTVPVATSTLYYISIVSEDAYGNRSVYSSLPPVTTGN